MLLATLLLLVLVLLVWAKMSNPQAGKEEKLQQPPVEQPVANSITKTSAHPSPLPPSAPLRAGRSLVAEQEQIAVYNPAALRRPALAKFVLGSFEDNSSDDELVATAFRVGSRRSSLAGAGGTSTEPPATATQQEPATGMRYGMWGWEQWWCKGAPVEVGRCSSWVHFSGTLLLKSGCICGCFQMSPSCPLCVGKGPLKLILSTVLWCCMKTPADRVSGSTPGGGEVSGHLV